ncbi:MAG: SdrD B-like domain-containing protein [Anaerolineales bacterium]
MRVLSYLVSGILILAILVGCAPASRVQSVPNEKSIVTTEEPATATPVPTATATQIPTPQPTLAPASYGPDKEDFPDDVNPFTGQPVADPDLLLQPALLVSITHFPPEARPQGGLSFASWVFEYLIAVGTTRFAAVFHGQVPYPEAPLTGGCDVRMEPFVQDGILLGNRVWQDQNGDGVQSPEEQGVGGVCINLYDEEGKLVQQTTTDSNGYYGFNVKAGTYSIEFVKPDDWEFTEPNVGYEETDSDADPATGRTEAIQVDSDVRLWDAGLIPLVEPDPADIPPAEIGPVRSARMIHIQLQNFLQDSCLIYAGATKEIRGQIPGCATVFKKYDGGIGSMLSISRMVAIADENAHNNGTRFNYAHNLFAEEVPAGGIPATEADMFFAQLNQSKWVYDPTYQGWLRYVDNTSEQTEFHVDVDRLNGRQISFENLIVLFVEHELIAPLIIDMNLRQGEEEKGLVFRDGQMYEIKWSTRAGKYEQTTGLRRPIAFLDKDGNPFPLRPGRSWIIIATPYSEYSQYEPGKWRFRIYAPPGTGLY